MAVIMPGHNSERSDFAFLLEVRGKTWRNAMVIDRRSSPFSHDPDLKPQPPVQATISAVPKDAKLIPLDEVVEIPQHVTLAQQNGVAILSSTVRVNEDYYDQARLKFEYWPDVMNHRELKMTPQPGGVNFKDIKD